MLQSKKSGSLFQLALGVAALATLSAAEAREQPAWRPSFVFTKVTPSSTEPVVEARGGFNQPALVAEFQPKDWAVLDTPAHVRAGFSSYTVAAGAPLTGFRSANGEITYCALPTTPAMGQDGRDVLLYDAAPSQFSSSSVIGCWLDRNGDGAFEEWFTSYNTTIQTPLWRLSRGSSGAESKPIPYRTSVEGRQPLGQLVIGLDKFEGQASYMVIATELDTAARVLRGRLFIGPKAEPEAPGGSAVLDLSENFAIAVSSRTEGRQGICLALQLQGGSCRLHLPRRMV